MFYFGTSTTTRNHFSQNFSFFDCIFFKNNGSFSGSIAEIYPPEPVNIFIYFENCDFINNTQISNEFTLGGLFNVWGAALQDSKTIETKNCIFKGIHTYNFILLLIFYK